MSEHLEASAIYRELGRKGLAEWIDGAPDTPERHRRKNGAFIYMYGTTREERMADDNLPQRRGEQDVASFSKEATARFLGGGELGRPTWADPAEQRRQDEQRELLRAALSQITPIMAGALHKHSQQAEASLTAHLKGALEGDIQSYRMYVAMLAELCKQALQP